MSENNDAVRRTTTDDVTPAMGKPVLADNETPEEVLVALGDDAEGAVGSTAPPETGGVDTGGSAPPETR